MVKRKTEVLHNVIGGKTLTQKDVVPKVVEEDSPDPNTKCLSSKW